MSRQSHIVTDSLDGMIAEMHVALDQPNTPIPTQQPPKEQDNITDINTEHKIHDKIQQKAEKNINLSYILENHNHLKWLFGPLHYFYALPSNKCNLNISRIYIFLINFIYGSFLFVFFYFYPNWKQLGSDSCSDDESKIGFILIVLTTTSNELIADQLWLNIFYQNKFNEICFNKDIFEAILTKKQRKTYAKKCLMRFFGNIIPPSILIFFLFMICTTLNPFYSNNYESLTTWIIFVVFFIFNTLTKIPGGCVVGTFWYYSDLLMKYIDYKTLEIKNYEPQVPLNADNNANMSDSENCDLIIKEYKTVRGYIEVASANYNIMSVASISLHVVAIILTVVYFLQCPNPNNIPLMIILLGCAASFILPLWYMAQVTNKAQEFEKVVLLKLDEFGLIRSGFTTYLLIQPIGYNFATTDIVMTGSLVYKIINVTVTVLIAVYKVVLTNR